MFKTLALVLMVVTFAFLGLASSGSTLIPADALSVLMTSTSLGSLGSLVLSKFIGGGVQSRRSRPASRYGGQATSRYGNQPTTAMYHSTPSGGYEGDEYAAYDSTPIRGQAQQRYIPTHLNSTSRIPQASRGGRPLPQRPSLTQEPMQDDGYDYSNPRR